MLQPESKTKADDFEEQKLLYGNDEFTKSAYRYRLGGTVDENRSGVPLALPVLLGIVWIFVDVRHSLKKDSAFRHAPVPIFIV